MIMLIQDDAEPETGNGLSVLRLWREAYRRITMKTILTILAVLYAISPFDLLPEVATGILGFIDDAILLFLLWRFFYAGKVGTPFGRPGASHSRFSGNERRFEEGETSESPKEKDPYQVLGLSQNASADEIKTAYKKLAAQYHPDKVHHLADEFKELAEKKFKEIQQAYEKIRRV